MARTAAGLVAQVAGRTGVSCAARWFGERPSSERRSEQWGLFPWARDGDATSQWEQLSLGEGQRVRHLCEAAACHLVQVNACGRAVRSPTP